MKKQTLTEDQLYFIFVEWKAKELSPTDPQNADEFCQKYKTTLKTLKAFTERAEYADDLLTYSLAWAKKRAPELIQMIYHQVKDGGSVNDLEKFLNVIFEIKKKEKPNQTQVNFFNNLPNDVYESIVKREARLLTDGRPEPTN